MTTMRMTFKRVYTIDVEIPESGNMEEAKTTAVELLSQAWFPDEPEYEFVSIESIED